MKNLLITNNGVHILMDKQEPRVSHIDIAESLGILPYNAMRQIKAYQADFEVMGVVAFKTRKPPKGEVGGRPEITAYLNEDQCFLLLSFSKNTPKVRAAKVCMVKAFKAARDQLAQRTTQYLPMHHAAHDSIGELVSLARTQGSTAHESKYHLCYEKLINDVFGIEAGSRGTLDARTQSAVTAAYATIDSTVHAATTQGLHYKDTYRLVKQSVHRLAAMMGTQRMEVLQ